MRRLFRTGTAGLAVAAALSFAPALTAPATAATQDDAERYFDEVAVELADPGVWVDPDVTLDSSLVADLDAKAADAPGPIRIAVIPASRIDTAGEDTYGTALAWEGTEIASQLYDRVGIDGTYAVMTVAESSSDGRGLHAMQHAEDGPTYYVEDAIDQAVECCAPDYGPMIDRFIERASVVDKPFLVDVAPWAGAGAAGVGLWWGGTALSARRKRRAEEAAHVATIRPLLDEEVIELSGRVSSLPTTADVAQAKLSKDVLDTVEKARHRLDALAGEEDVHAVTTLLGSARYSLVCPEALRDGRPAPERTQPCFFDPRHGPSTGHRPWEPDQGAAREVPVCTDCGERIDRSEEPAARTIGGRSYWTAGEAVVAYIDGYWHDDDIHWSFPSNRYRDTRRRLHERRRSRTPRRKLAMFTDSVGRGLASAGREMSESSTNSRSSGRGHSSRRRSSGGGSSRRSSGRSGGSRGF